LDCKAVQGEKESAAPKVREKSLVEIVFQKEKGQSAELCLEVESMEQKVAPRHRVRRKGKKDRGGGGSHQKKEESIRAPRSRLPEAEQPQSDIKNRKKGTRDSEDGGRNRSGRHGGETAPWPGGKKRCSNTPKVPSRGKTVRCAKKEVYGQAIRKGQVSV